MTDFRLGQTIYAPTKTGNIKTWCCSVSGDSPATLTITTQTKLDGKKVVRREVITQGKNLGKKNETTPYEQAVSEARSRYNKKIDQGYSPKMPTDLSKANHNALDLPKPMLAHPIEKVKDVQFPAFWQTKLDGHRALVTRRDGELIMYSRQGKRIETMTHILDELESIVKEGMTLDGELYCHNLTLQQIGSLVKRHQSGSRQILYEVYDLVDINAPYVDRLSTLRELFAFPITTKSVHLLPSVLVNTLEQAQHLTEGAIQSGYEGGILRTPDKGYLAGFRSRNLLKIKKFDDNEFYIEDVIRGKQRNVNGRQLEVAIFVCSTEEGKTFECTAFGDMFEKDFIWHNREKYLGQMLTVKHSGFTKDGIPFHATAVRIREDI